MHAADCDNRGVFVGVILDIDFFVGIVVADTDTIEFCGITNLGSVGIVEVAVNGILTFVGNDLRGGIGVDIVRIDVVAVIRIVVDVVDVDDNDMDLRGVSDLSIVGMIDFVVNGIVVGNTDPFDFRELIV